MIKMKEDREKEIKDGRKSEVTVGSMYGGQTKVGIWR